MIPTIQLVNDSETCRALILLTPLFAIKSACFRGASDVLDNLTKTQN